MDGTPTTTSSAAPEAAAPQQPQQPQQEQSPPNDDDDDGTTSPEDAAAIKSHLERLIATRLPRSPLYAFLLSGARVASASRGAFAARLRLGPEHINAGGSLHGGASAAMVDWAGGMAVATTRGLPEATGVSVDIHVRYLAGAREGEEVEVAGWAERVGRSLAFTRVEIRRVRDGVLVASGTHTKYVK